MLCAICCQFWIMISFFLFSTLLSSLSCWFVATEVVTVFVFQEPSLLSSLQDNGLTDVMLHALLIKDVSFKRCVLFSPLFPQFLTGQNGFISFLSQYLQLFYALCKRASMSPYFSFKTCVCVFFFFFF